MSIKEFQEGRVTAVKDANSVKRAIRGMVMTWTGWR
jgi:hypothetical protein